MNTTTQASRFIPITNPDLRFMGRIDRTPADHQTWAFPYTQVSFRCTGTSIGVRLVNHWGYGDAYLGAIIDGMQVKARVPIDGAHDVLTCMAFCWTRERSSCRRRRRCRSAASKCTAIP